MKFSASFITTSRNIVENSRKKGRVKYIIFHREKKKTKKPQQIWGLTTSSFSSLHLIRITFLTLSFFVVFYISKR